MAATGFGCQSFKRNSGTPYRQDDTRLSPAAYANGKALEGLAALVRDSGAELVGAGIVIEKGFQVGGDLLRSEGIRLESLAIVESMDEETQTIVFRDDE